MLFLKLFFRNLRRGGIYSVINIGGLAVGMAAAALILLWIHHEWSFDRFHAKAPQLYVAYNRAMFDGKMSCWNYTPKPLASALKADYPEIAATTRFSTTEFLCTHGENMIRLMTGCIDPSFLTMFDFPLLQGDAGTALNDPYSIILTEQAAHRLFGDDDPMGKTLRVHNAHILTVTGVMEDMPGNTLFNFEALAPVAFMKTLGWWDEAWGNNSLQTYVELQSGASLDRVNESVREIYGKYGGQDKTELFLYPLERQHLWGQFENGVPAGGFVDNLRIFGLIAGLLLLTSCINFTNLSTARSQMRARETGIRKVLGGKRAGLTMRYLGESTLTAFIAGTVAVMIILLVLPLFDMLIGRQLTIDISNVRMWLVGAGFILFTGLLAGIYPAFYLSSFRPVKVIKGMAGKTRSAVSLRKLLSTVQFTVACGLTAATLIVYMQNDFAMKRDVGYSREHLIRVPIDGDVGKNIELIRRELLDSGTALSVTKNSAPMTENWSSTWGVEWKGKNPEDRTLINMYFTDAGWAATTGVTIAEGRDIDIHAYPTDSMAMLLNETAVKVMGFDNPVGEIVRTQGREWHVVGVVKDFILQSPFEPVSPMFVGGPAGWFNTVHVRLNGERGTAENLARAEEVFRKYNPAYPFEYKFVDEEYARKFSDLRKTGILAALFAGLTVFVSCLGLFALVAYMAEARRREIGIRKVLGASVASVMQLLTREFLMPVLISIAVATPITWWIMERWLADSAYRIDLSWWLFAAVGLLILCITMLTVGFRAYRAATANPVNAIKAE